MNQRFTVGISDWTICRSPDSLITYALGSCVGICLYDKAAGLAGLSHIMLPDSKAIKTDSEINRMKFADTAIQDMLKRMTIFGASPGRITAKIAGGADMFGISTNSMKIGERNVLAVKAELSRLRIPVIAEDVGENYGRTVTFFAQDGSIEVKSTIKGIKTM